MKKTQNEYDLEDNPQNITQEMMMTSQIRTTPSKNKVFFGGGSTLGSDVTLHLVAVFVIV